MRRLRRIGLHPVLLVHAVADGLWRRFQLRLLRLTYGRRVARPPGGASLRLPDIDLAPAARLHVALADAARQLRHEADEICRHSVDFLGSGAVELGPQIDWHRDFKSGYRWPKDFYQDVEVTRLTDDSDAKVPWELSRGHHLLTLARATCVFQEESYARELESQLKSWLDANPPGVGINWTNPMEVAIRAVNWIWAIATVEGYRPLDSSLRTALTASLQSHGRHIAANLEATPLLRSNHYLSDLLGLLALGATLEGDPLARRWFRFGRRELEREIRHQVHDDGAGFEASLPYHGLALEIFLLARLVAVRMEQPFSSAYDERVRDMLELSRTVRHPDGRLPQFGDGDSGRVLPAGFGRPPTQDHLLWLGAAILDRERPVEGEVHPEVAWTLGIAAFERSACGPLAARTGSEAFPDAGLYVLRGGDAHVVFRCGDVGQDGNGGHAHNDLLSYELSYGRPLVVDCGTYAYTSDPAARNQFRSTRFHNAVVVDGVEIHPIDPDELFRLEQFAHPVTENWDASGPSTTVTASHDGYRRLRGCPVHRRTVELQGGTGAFSVQDEVSGEGEHALMSLVHLAPEVCVTRTDAEEFELEADQVTITLSFWGLGGDVRIEDAWVSDRYGTRERTKVLCAPGPSRIPARFGYRFVPDGPGRLEGAESTAEAAP